ncbi:MAG: phosphomannomutase [Desulfovibrionaceae bacterium]|nr:phosphomannomutase [Desulfovibrionaceae bacterium]
MTTSLSCFKAYDVRGKVPQVLNEKVAYAVGKAFAMRFGAKCVVSGHDARLSGPSLQKALMAGLEAGGVRPVDIGLCNTEEIYYASALRDGTNLCFDGGIMVTGSHNPADENGLKFVRGGAIPVSGDTGLNDVRDLAAGILATDAEFPAKPKDVELADFRDGYLDFVCRTAPLSSSAAGNRRRRLKIHIDPGNGCGGLLARPLCERLGLDWTGANLNPDGTFPNGVPNPLLPEKRAETAAAVRAHKADMGIAWDGDADRCFFYDEEGRFLEGYYLVGLLAEAMLKQHPGSKIIHDPRLCWNTIDIVSSLGGIPVQSKTGHAFIKERMRAEDAVYGGEMSAHHYFREFAYCDSGTLPWLLVAGLLCTDERTLGERVHEREKLYPCSGEINSRVEDAAAVMQTVQKRYAAHAVAEEHVDGLSMTFDKWRFNLRSSNTEPLLRLNVESRGDKSLMEDRTSELLELIRK